jgi:hypothetical protein
MHLIFTLRRKKINLRSKYVGFKMHVNSVYVDEPAGILQGICRAAAVAL